MSDIPDEVRVELAKDYVRHNFESCEPWSMTIARAILAERERCASLVDSCEITLLEYPNDQAAAYYQAGALDAVLAAAEAIRKSPTPSTPPKTGV